jgi:glycosyltransferase involved in cell wall biosynthesis
MHPSGADIENLGYVDHTQNRSDRLIMTGTLGYLPNLDAATWFIDRILPLVRERRPSAKLVLVGASPPASMTRRAAIDVEVVGRVPDVQPYLDGGDLFIAPLREGGGSRLKLLEAFAVGLPTVATTVASAGIDAVAGTHLAIADDEAAFADAVVRLLEDSGARGALAQAARRLVEDRYDWRSIALAYERDLLDVAGASGERGASDRPSSRSNSNS